MTTPDPIAPSRLQTISRYVVLAVICVLVILPMVWLITSSLRSPVEMFDQAGKFSWGLIWPMAWTFENYISLFKNTSFGRAVGNSLFVSTVAMVFGILINAAAGFAFAVFNFPGRTIAFIFVLVTAMMPFEAIVIPLYVLVTAMGFADTYSALIVPDLANGFVIFLFRQFFAALPREFFEAAKVDGASWTTIFFKLALPMSWPVVLTGGVMIFIHQFEAFFWPLVIAPSAEHTVAQVAIAKNLSMEGTAWGHLFSSMTIASLIPLIPFLIFQRFYIKNNLTAGLK